MARLEKDLKKIKTTLGTLKKESTGEEDNMRS